MTVMGTVLSKEESASGGGKGQFIYDEGTHEVMHYVDSQGSE
jgi:hypothetical protein